MWRQRSSRRPRAARPRWSRCASPTCCPVSAGPAGAAALLRRTKGGCRAAGRSAGNPILPRASCRRRRGRQIPWARRTRPVRASHPANLVGPAAVPTRRCAAGVRGADGGVRRRGSQAFQVHGSHEGVHRGVGRRRGAGLRAGKHGSHPRRWAPARGPRATSHGTGQHIVGRFCDDAEAFTPELQALRCRR